MLPGLFASKSLEQFLLKAVGAVDAIPVAPCKQAKSGDEVRAAHAGDVQAVQPEAG